MDVAFAFAIAAVKAESISMMDGHTSVEKTPASQD
jgi:hypothetical protein